MFHVITCFSISPLHLLSPFSMAQFFVFPFPGGFLCICSRKSSTSSYKWKHKNWLQPNSVNQKDKRVHGTYPRILEEEKKFMRWEGRKEGIFLEYILSIYIFYISTISIHWNECLSLEKNGGNRKLYDHIFPEC